MLRLTDAEGGGVPKEALGQFFLLVLPAQETELGPRAIFLHADGGGPYVQGTGIQEPLHGKGYVLRGHIVQIAAELPHRVRHLRASIWFIMLARYPAPKPLSMFTTDTPLAQELSILRRAARPPKAAP